RLKVVGVETGIGWIPSFLEVLDESFLRRRWRANTHLKRLPSEYFKEHVWSTFISDMHGLANRHEIGIDHIMWSTDYPHSNTNWPDSQRLVAREFINVP